MMIPASGLMETRALSGLTPIEETSPMMWFGLRMCFSRSSRDTFLRYCMEPPCGSMSARARASRGSMMVLRFPSLTLESSTSVRPSLCMARWRSLSPED